MDLIEFRDYCLSLGDVTEKTPFGKFAKRYDSVLVFYIVGHMFCMVDMDDFNHVNISLPFERIAELKDMYEAVNPPIHRTMRYWTQINFDGDISDDIIYQLIGEAYSNIKSKYTPKRR